MYQKLRDVIAGDLNTNALKASLNNLKKNAQQNLSRFFSHAISTNCVLCGMENEQLICHHCTDHFFSATPNRCISCALPILAHDTHCGNCLKTPPAFNATMVACDYVAPFDQLILSLKFGHRLAIATALANLLAKTVLNSPNLHALPEFLIAIPLSHERLAQRGFNQALAIATPLAHLLERPIYARLLHRVRDTTAQTLLHPNQRHKNILHAFSLNGSYADKIQGRHIGVVDDVMTTGATLHEVATCLKRHGAARVSNIVFARTPPP